MLGLGDRALGCRVLLLTLASYCGLIDGEVWAAWTHLSGSWVLEQTFLLGFRVLDRGLFLPAFATAWNPTSAGSSAYRSPSNKQGGAAGELESLELFWGRAQLGRVSKLDLSAVVSIVVGRKEGGPQLLDTLRSP